MKIIIEGGTPQELAANLAEILLRGWRDWDDDRSTSIEERAADEVGKIIAALDASLGLQARIDALPEVAGVSWHSVLTLWPDSNPAIEGAFRGWATAHEYKVNEVWSHYGDGTSILAWTAVDARSRDVARAQWRSVKTDEHPAAKADKESHEARRIVREERAAAQSGVSP